MGKGRLNMKHILLKFITMGMFLPIPLFSSLEIEPKNDIETSLTQSILIHNIIKHYAMLGMNMNSELAKRNLLNEIDIFSKNLVLLHRGYFQNQTLNEILDIINKQWSEIKELLSLPPSDTTIKTILPQVKTLFKNLNELTQTLSKSKGYENDEVENTLEVQSVLSQEIMALYILSGWKEAGMDLSTLVKESVDRYRTGLETLKIKASNNVNTQKQLKKLDRLFFIIKMQIRADVTKFIPYLVIKESKKMLQLEQQTLHEYLEKKENK
jgi:hypothetical protein